MTMLARRFAVFGIAGSLAVAVACGGDGAGALTAGSDGGASSDASATSDGGLPVTADAEPSPEVVAQDLGTPWEIACDERAAFVTYETDGGRSTLYRLEPSVAPAAIATDPVRGRDVAVDDTRVYWVAGGTGGWSYVHVLDKTTDGGQKPDDYFSDGSGSSSFSLLRISEKGSSLTRSTTNRPRARRSCAAAATEATESQSRRPR